MDFIEVTISEDNFNVLQSVGDKVLSPTNKTGKLPKLECYSVMFSSVVTTLRLQYMMELH